MPSVYRLLITVAAISSLQQQTETNAVTTKTLMKMEALQASVLADQQKLNEYGINLGKSIKKAKKWAKKQAKKAKKDFDVIKGQLDEGDYTGAVSSAQESGSKWGKKGFTAMDKVAKFAEEYDDAEGLTSLAGVKLKQYLESQVSEEDLAAARFAVETAIETEQAYEDLDAQTIAEITEQKLTEELMEIVPEETIADAEAVVEAAIEAEAKAEGVYDEYKEATADTGDETEAEAEVEAEGEDIAAAEPATEGEATAVSLDELDKMVSSLDLGFLGMGSDDDLDLDLLDLDIEDEPSKGIKLQLDSKHKTKAASKTATTTANKSKLSSTASSKSKAKAKSSTSSHAHSKMSRY